MTEAIVRLDPTTRDMQIRITGFPLVAAHLSKIYGRTCYIMLQYEDCETSTVSVYSYVLHGIFESADVRLGIASFFTISLKSSRFKKNTKLMK